jgi:hypothetical protein
MLFAPVNLSLLFSLDTIPSQLGIFPSVRVWDPFITRADLLPLLIDTSSNSEG